MSHPNKAKGTAAESKAVQHAREHGIPAYRPAQAGAKDVGDIHGFDNFVLQVKDYADVTAALREGVKGAQVQAVNAGRPYGVALIKNRRKSVGDWYVAMSYDDFIRLYKKGFGS